MTGQWYYVDKLKELRAAWGGRCVMCGKRSSKTKRGRYIGPLEFAHLRDTGLNGKGRGAHARWKNIVTHPNDYVLLCKSCHGVLDL